ncbi:hypothetical protein DYB30_001181 [Aphanomyces astaci]|uniref:HSF-type DNA-binding domain-containing protein n=1 Tax=Aphanomyces astaci TaxID=112090 RepID=A0A397C8H7_APHAT|nr:hypothetical protein DYB30_001181 [Aphanomyces astaci]
MVFPDSLDADLSEFLMEGSFEQTSDDVGSSDDAIDYDASTESHLNQYAFPVPRVTIQEEFHAMHRPNFAEHTTKYLEKLYTMLEQCPESIATWTQDGSSFAVLDANALERTIIPKFFKPIKFDSFVRQLNSYGFRKAKYMVANKAVFAFRHANFVRGESHQLQAIQRRRRGKREQLLTAPVVVPDNVVVVAAPSPDAPITLESIVSFVRTLQQELADTKTLVHALMACQPLPPPPPSPDRSE